MNLEKRLSRVYLSTLTHSIPIEQSVSSGWSGWPVLLIAIAAVHRPGAIGLEGNLTCLSALSASGIVHLSWSAVKAASGAASISFHLIHLPLASIPRIDPTTKHPIKLD